MKHQVLVTWYDEIETYLTTVSRIVLYDMPTLSEYQLVRTNRPDNLIAFACHRDMLWPPYVECVCTDAPHPPYLEPVSDDDHFEEVPAAVAAAAVAPYRGAAPADVDDDDVPPAAMDDDDDLPPIETCGDLPRPLWPLGDTDDDEDDDGYSYLPSSSSQSSADAYIILSDDDDE